MKPNEPISIQDYNPEWRQTFHDLATLLKKTVGNLALAIEHVGSTSVVGLAAKPIIDLDIIVENETNSQKVIAMLETLGYEHIGNLGILQRQAFRRPDDWVPRDGSGRTWQRHNLYVCIEGADSLKNHLGLREYLRNNPDAVVEYSQLKRELAKRHPYDIEKYVEGKTAFITSILEKIGFGNDSLKAITAQNRARYGDQATEGVNTRFHLAFKVRDIPSTRRFYKDILGCEEGRSTDHWIDFNFFGHQLSAHVADELPPLDYCGQVDGIAVPIPHFGCVLNLPEFNQVRTSLEQARVPWIIEPYLRYEGKPGAQWTMFVLDLSGNPLEFKAFLDPREVF